MNRSIKIKKVLCQIGSVIGGILMFCSSDNLYYHIAIFCTGLVIAILCGWASIKYNNQLPFLKGDRLINKLQNWRDLK